MLIFCKITLLVLTLTEIHSTPSDLDCADIEHDEVKFFPDDENCNSYFQCNHGKLLRNYCAKMNDTMGNQLFILHWDRMNNVSLIHLGEFDYVSQTMPT